MTERQRKLVGLPHFGAATTWDTAWVSLRFRSVDGPVVSYLRWYADVGDNRLVAMLAHDDPVLKQVNLGYGLEVAAVRGRGRVMVSRRYHPANLEILSESEAGWVGQELNTKYGARRWVFRPASWVVKLLDGSRRGSDVPIRLELTSTATRSGSKAAPRTEA